MAFDTHSIFALSFIQTIVSQDATNLVATLQSGDGSLFAINQQVIIGPTTGFFTKATAMIGRVTGISTDTLTINVTSGNREGSNVRTALSGDCVINGYTPKILTDIEANVTILLGRMPVGTVIGNTDTQTLSNKTLVNPIVTTEFDNGNSGASKTIAWTNGGKQKLTISANTTLTFSGAVSGEVLTLWLIENGTGNFSITLPTIKWAGGAAPTFTTSANAVNAIIVRYDGTNYYGQSAVGFA